MKSKSPAGGKRKSRTGAEINDGDRYDPVPFVPAERIARMRRISPEYRAAYDALEDEFAALDVLLKARREAGLTQTQVAKRMGVSQPVLARLEGSLGNRKSSPTLATLRRYAAACGKKLVLQMI